MGQRDRNKIIYAKIEAVSGTPETLVATDAVKTSGVAITPYAGNRVSQEYDRAGLGNDREVNVVPHGQISNFQVPMIGSGATGTKPAWGQLLRACAMAETDDTATNNEWYYTPVDTGFESITVGFRRETIQQTLAGVRGNWGINMQAGNLPWLTFSQFIGSYSRPIATTLPAPDNSAFKDAVPITKSNTPTLTIGASQYPVNSFTLDGGVSLERINIVAREETLITDRRPTGTIVVSPAASADIIALFAAVESHAGQTDQVIAVKHGSGAGSIVEVDLAGVAFSDITETVSSGEVFYSIPFSVQTVGDEIKITQGAT